MNNNTILHKAVITITNRNEIAQLNCFFKYTNVFNCDSAVIQIVYKRIDKMIVTVHSRYSTTDFINAYHFIKKILKTC